MADKNQPIDRPITIDEAFGGDEHWGFSMGESDEFEKQEYQAPPAPEFGTVPSPFDQPAAIDEPQHGPAIVKEIDFGDGNRIRIEANDPDDLAQKIIDAQNEYFQNLMLNQDQDYAPRTIAPPVQHRKITPPTPEDIQEAYLLFMKDPLEANRRFTEWNLGMSVEELQEMHNESKAIVIRDYNKQIGQDFISRHLQFNEYNEPVAGDYYPCKANSARILKLLENEGRYPSPENYEYAFSKLKAINGLVQPPDGFFASDQGEDPEYEDQASTAMSARESYYPQSSRGLDDDEFNRRAAAGQVSINEMERYYASRARQTRGR